MINPPVCTRHEASKTTPYSVGCGSDWRSGHLQEKEQLIGAVMRHMLFRQKQKPDQPVRRDELAKLFQVGGALLILPLLYHQCPAPPLQ